MGEDGGAGGAMRIVLELSRESETVAGTLTAAEGSRSFWGWLELMSALELASGASSTGPAASGVAAQQLPPADVGNGEQP